MEGYIITINGVEISIEADWYERDSKKDEYVFYKKGRFGKEKIVGRIKVENTRNVSIKEQEER